MTHYSPVRILSVAPAVMSRTLSELIGPNSRAPEIVAARMILFGVIRELSDWSFPEIALATSIGSHSIAHARYSRWLARVPKDKREMWMALFRAALSESKLSTISE